MLYVITWYEYFNDNKECRHFYEVFDTLENAKNFFEVWHNSGFTTYLSKTQYDDSYYLTRGDTSRSIEDGDGWNNEVLAEIHERELKNYSHIAFKECYCNDLSSIYCTKCNKAKHLTACKQNKLKKALGTCQCEGI